jgi:hypothetical protein
MVNLDALVIDIGDTVIVHPAPDVLIELSNTMRHKDAPAPTGESFKLMLNVSVGSVSPHDVFTLEAKTEEFTSFSSPY